MSFRLHHCQPWCCPQAQLPTTADPCGCETQVQPSLVSRDGQETPPIPVAQVSLVQSSVTSTPLDLLW
jgi:hypothetical protein